MTASYFTFDHNRSERALQTELLAPALRAPDGRWALLSRLDTGDEPIDRAESDAARAMHFVWVLRDTFTAERDAARPSNGWAALRDRWNHVLGLAAETAPAWWRHPTGSFDGDPDFAVHPCHRTIGWTRPALERRAERFDLALSDELATALERARKTMNTECDALVQTPRRLIVVECKDKTGFSSEQRARQRRLFECLERLLPREQPLVYVEVSAEERERDGRHWGWGEVRGLA